MISSQVFVICEVTEALGMNTAMFEGKKGAGQHYFNVHGVGSKSVTSCLFSLRMRPAVIPVELLENLL